MTSFVTGTAAGNTLVTIAFDAKLQREHQVRNFFMGHRGLVAPAPTDEDTFERPASAPIISSEELNNKRAYQVRTGLSRALDRNVSQSAGRRSLNAYSYSTTGMGGNEQTMTLHYAIAYVEQMKNATSFVTPELQDLRVRFKMKVVGANVLADWMTREQEESCLDAPYDKFSAHSTAGLTLTQADPPTANLKFPNGKTAEDQLTTGDELTMTELMRMAAFCETGPSGGQPLNPINIANGEYYLLLVHPYNFNDLLGSQEFREVCIGGSVRGETDSPYFKYADARMFNILIYKYPRIRVATTNANVRKCLLLGSNAIVQGVTARPHLVERKEDDYGDVYGVGIKAINGWTRTDWIPDSGTTFNQSMAIWNVFTKSAA